MKNTSTFVTYSDIPVMIELTDEDLAMVTAGHGADDFDDSNDGGHRDHGHRRHDNRHDRDRHDHRHDRR